MSDWDVPEPYTFAGQEVRWGKMGEGQPVVLLHGTPFSSYEWHRVAPHLAHDHTVFFHDMLGYGHSEKNDGQDVSLGVQNELIRELFVHWGLDRPHVVAHDFGGATALRAHLLNGLEYATLTLIDAVAVSPWGSPLVQHVKSHESAFANMPAYMHLAVLPAYLRSAIHRDVTDDDLEPYITPWTGEANQKAFYRQIAQMDEKYTREVEESYPQIRCPVQILWGREDQWIPISSGRKLAGMIPHSQFHTIPSSGHLMQEDAPEAIIFHVSRFINEKR